MQIGVVLPQTEIGADAGAVRAYGEAVEALGYRHILTYDHVMGADPAVHAGWSGPYDIRTTFHEPFVLYGFLAGITSLELVTGIIEEQVGLLRQLWTEPSVTFTGHFDTVTGAGLAPLPVQRPIPVWFGGQSPRAYQRSGRMADGWFPHMPPGPDLEAAKVVVAASAVDAGRDPSTIGMEGRLSWRGDLESFTEQLMQWRNSGATHLSINTMNAGLEDVAAHLAILTTTGRALGLVAA